MGIININIKISEELHRKAKSRASLEGWTLKDYIILCIHNEVNKNENK
jgi:predicted HicB family RNase H-like nuclease